MDAEVNRDRHDRRHEHRREHRRLPTLSSRHREDRKPAQNARLDLTASRVTALNGAEDINTIEPDDDARYSSKHLDERLNQPTRTDGGAGARSGTDRCTIDNEDSKPRSAEQHHDRADDQVAARRSYVRPRGSITSCSTGSRSRSPRSPDHAPDERDTSHTIKAAMIRESQERPVPRQPVPAPFGRSSQRDHAFITGSLSSSPGIDAGLPHA